MFTVAVVDSPAWSVTVTVASYSPLAVGVHERVVALVDWQPAGSFEYEYDRPPYPPFVETANVIFSPESGLAGEEVKEVIERSELTLMLVVLLLHLCCESPG